MAAFTDAPASVHEESAVDWSNGVLAPVTDKEKENAKFTSPDRVTFYSDNAANYDRDMVKYSFRLVLFHYIHRLILCILNLCKKM